MEDGNYSEDGDDGAVHVFYIFLFVVKFSFKLLKINIFISFLILNPIFIISIQIFYI